MKKNNQKKSNELQNKSKLKIPQPNKNNSINLHYKNKNSYNYKHNIKKSKSSYKDSLDENISESKANILIPDSLNNTKRSIIENKIINTSSNNYDTLNNKKNIDKNEEETKKIDYRYYTNYPMKEYLSNQNLIHAEKKKKKKYWIATYDKMMKKQKLIKILNYYSKDKKYKDNDIKERLMQIKDFEIYFPQNSNQPLIKYNKNEFIFSKLYLLSLDNLNILLSYINRIKINIKENELENLIIKGNCKIFTENNNFKYNIVYYMGTFLNINIYGFSSLYNNDYKNNKIIPNLDNSKPIENKFPNPKKIAKLVEILLNNFPKYNSDYFISYLLSKIKVQYYIQKLKEIKNYIYSKNTADKHHKIINSNCLAEVVAFTTSFTAESAMTPYSSAKNYYFRKKNYNNTTKNIKNINNIIWGNGEIGKYPTFINNNIYLVGKDSKKINNKKANDKNIMKIFSTKKEKISPSYNNKMNYVKISLKKNISKSKSNKRSIFIFNTYTNTENKNKNKYKRGIQNKEKIINNKATYSNMSFNQSYSKQLKPEKYNILPNYSLINNNNCNKINESKLINNKTKKSTEKPSICFDKTRGKNFFYNKESQQYSFNKFKNKNNIKNNNNAQNNNSLFDSFELENYINKNNINGKNIEKDEKKEKSKNEGIFVVNRRIKTDIEDDDSSIILLNETDKKSNKKEEEDSKEFITPYSRKKKKYYL